MRVSSSVAFLSLLLFLSLPLVVRADDDREREGSNDVSFSVVSANYKSLCTAASCDWQKYISQTAWTKSWENWSSNYTSCAIKTKADADNNLIKFATANCGSQQSVKGCTIPSTQVNCGRDLSAYIQSLLTKNFGTASSPFTSNEYWNYARQTSACSTYTTGASSTTSSSAPSALESFPFSQIQPAGNDTAALVESIDLNDFIPAMWRLSNVDQTANPTVTDRADIRALSSANQVLGVDYPSGSNLRGGMLLAAGERVIEHNIATCARFLGGDLNAVQQSLFGVDAVVNATTGPHVMNVGSVNQVDTSRGAIFVSSFVVLLTRASAGSNDYRMDVYHAWDATATPILIQEARGIDVTSLSSRDLAFVTVQVWSSISDKAFFYQLVSAALDQLSAAQIPVHYHFLLDRSDPALVPTVNGTQIQLQASDYKPTSALENPEVGSESSTVPLSAKVYAWVERLAFVFPSRLTMRIKAIQLSRLSSVNLTITGFASPSQPATFTNTTLLSTSLFTLTSESIGGQPVWSYDESVDMTQLLDVVVTVTGKLADGLGGGNGAPSQAYLEAATQDKTYSNSGFFYVSHADPSNGNAVATAFTGLDSNTLSSIPSATLNGAASVPLPGSASTVATSNTRTQTIVRGLTPHSDPVDLSGYQGLQFFVRVRQAENAGVQRAATNNSAAAMSLIVSLDSASASFPSTSAISLSESDCWYGFNIPMSDFATDRSRLIGVKALLFTLSPSDAFFNNGGDLNSFINSISAGTPTPSLIPIGDVSRAAETTGTTANGGSNWVYEIAKIALDQQYQAVNIDSSSGVCTAKVEAGSTSNQGPKLNGVGKAAQSGWASCLMIVLTAMAMILGLTM